MRVYMITHNPPFQGGIVQHCVLLANSLRRKVNLSVVGYKRLYPPVLYKGKLPRENRSAINFEMPCPRRLSWANPFSWVRAFLDVKNCDVIHLHWVTAFLEIIYYVILTLNKWFGKKPVVLTCHNITDHERVFLMDFMSRKIFRRVTHFVVHTGENKRRLIRNYGISKEQISVIEHGPFDFFTRYVDGTQEEQKEKFGIPGKNVILFFGYIREYKGLIYLIRAFKKVLQKVPNTVLLIAGELWEPLKKYEGEMKKIGLEGHVIFNPNYILDQDVWRYFVSADIVVLPYCNTEQTISGPMLVGFAFARPVIISAVGGIPDLVKHEENGLLVEPGNPETLTDAILTLLKNKQLRNSIASNGRTCVQRNTWEDVSVAYEAVYKKAIQYERTNVDDR